MILWKVKFLKVMLSRFAGILAGFSDIQTVFLACISTLLPLIVALGIAFGIR